MLQVNFKVLLDQENKTSENNFLTTVKRRTQNLEFLLLRNLGECQPPLPAGILCVGWAESYESSYLTKTYQFISTNFAIVHHKPAKRRFTISGALPKVIRQVLAP